MWKAIRFPLQRRKISRNLFILFLPLAKMSFNEWPLDVGIDASNTMQHGVDTEDAFYTAFQGIKFWTGFKLRVFWASLGRFFTNSTNPLSWSFFSALMMSCLSLTRLRRRLSCWMYTRRAISLFGESLKSGSFIKGIVAIVVHFSMSTLTERLIKSCSIYSRVLITSSLELCLQVEQLRQLTHLSVTADPIASNRSCCFTWNIVVVIDV